MSDNESKKNSYTQTDDFDTPASDVTEKEFAQHDMYKEQYLRLMADFENYKRRIEKEKISWIYSGQIALLTDLLEIVDDFDRAHAQYSAGQSSQQMPLAWQEGFNMIYKGLQKKLAKYHVTEIKDTVVFDPTIHEALVQVDNPEYASGSIVAILEKGYKYKDIILRPAKVSVAK